MRVVGRKRLNDFCRQHRDVRAAADAWLAEVDDAEWQTPHDLKARYPRASLLGRNRVIFDLRGNRYRLDVKVDYRQQLVLIIRVGTHAEYDDWQF